MRHRFCDCLSLFQKKAEKRQKDECGLKNGVTVISWSHGNRSRRQDKTGDRFWKIARKTDGPRSVSPAFPAWRIGRKKKYSFAETQITSSKNGKDYDMQEKAIASEKLVAAKWPGGQVLPLDRHPLAGRLGRDCFPASRIHSTPKSAPVLIGGGAA